MARGRKSSCIHAQPGRIHCGRATGMNTVEDARIFVLMAKEYDRYRA